MSFDPRAGACNLLENCVGATQGDSVAIVAEDPSLGFYDALAARCIAEVAEELGCRVRRIPCGCVSGPEELPEEVIDAFDWADHVIFQARAGDQVRFTTLPGNATKTMSYALDIGMLGSAFCTVHHKLMEELLYALEAELARGRTWRIRCPLGTQASGSVLVAESSSTAGTALNEFSLKLFPVPIFRPVLCKAMSGRVVLCRWLMSTANHVYEDDSLMLPEPIAAIVERGRITGFKGPTALVRAAQDHYRRVADLFGIDPDTVHSWHAGIHPQAFYPLKAEADINRWGSVAFANPRYAHFHTCGDYAPGEIAWSIFDATIELDERPLWEKGRFLFLDRLAVHRLAEKYGVPPQVLEQRWDIGLGDGQGPDAAP